MIDIAFKMNTVNFSHFYHKMHGFDLSKPFTLVSVVQIDCAKLDPTFVKYDTSYLDLAGISYNEETGMIDTNDKFPFQVKNYPLPKGMVLILYLVQDYMMMTTVRRYTPSKASYYNSLVGKEVMIKVSQE